MPKKLDSFIFLLTLPPSFLPPILSNLNKSLFVEGINTLELSNLTHIYNYSMKLKRLLSLAMLCVAGWTGHAYAYEVGQNITPPSVQKEWIGKTGSYQSKYAEKYSETAYTSGKILYMSIDNLESKGYYEVQFYAVTSMAWNNFATGMNIAEWYVNDVSDYMNVIAQTDCTPESETNLRKATVYVEDGKLEFGIRNIATGGNWYVTHLKSIVYKGKANSTNPIDVTSTYIKNAGFETGTTDGWATTSSSDTGARSTTNDIYKTNGSQGNWLFNTWSQGTPCTQTIKKLPAGKYELSAMVASDGATIYMINGNNSDDYAYVETTDKAIGKTLSKEFSLLSETSDYKIGVVGGADGKAGEHKPYVAAGHWWYKADNFQLKYYGNTIDVHAIKKDLDTPISIEANKWYAFPINIASDYAFKIGKGNIIYTQDGTQDLSTATGVSVTNQEKFSLTKGLVYIKSATANTVTLTSAVDSYDLGSVVTNVADNSYIQNGTISFTYPNQISTKQDAVTELVDGAKGTINGIDAAITKTDKGFELSIASIEAGKDYVIKVPAGIYGYTGHAMNAAQTITLHTPAIFDGTYYFYNNDNKKYLSRGGNYATQAIVDEYGIAIVVKTDNENNTELKPFDSYLNLGFDGFMYTDAQGNNIRKFNATKVDGGYKFLNTTNQKYLATNNGQVVGDAVEGGNLQGKSNIWTLESVNDHLTVVKTYEDSQAKAAATAAGIVVSNKAELENTLKVENIYPQQIAIKGTQGAVKENYQGGASNAQVSKPLDIFAETVNGLRPGLYKLSVNAFQRATLFNDVMNAGGARGKVYVYANDAKTQLKSIAEEYSDEAYTEGWNPNLQSEGKNYPNSKEAANQAFAKNMYVNDVYVYVNADEGSNTGTLKFGIQNPTRLGNDNSRGAWTCYNNFTLTYYAQTADEIVDGVHYYYTSCDAPEFTLTDEVPVVDATNAKITNATIVRKNPNGIVYLAEGSTADNGNNIVVNGTCANLVLTDGHPFTATKNFEATKATYTMTAIAASIDKSFGTIMLPYAINSLPNGAKAYTLENNVVLGEDIYATEVSTIAANTPTIVTAKGTYAANDVAIAATKSTYENGQLVGTYKAMEAIENSYVLQKHNERVAFYLVNNTKPTVKPFRAYIKPQSTNAKQFIKVVFDGEATGIKEITSDNTKAEIFDLSGRRVAKAQKGVYIINGKKVIKK